MPRHADVVASDAFRWRRVPMPPAFAFAAFFAIRLFRQPMSPLRARIARYASCRMMSPPLLSSPASFAMPITAASDHFSAASFSTPLFAAASDDTPMPPLFAAEPPSH